MKTIRLYNPNDLRFEEAPLPIPGENEVLLKTASVGICGSDIHYYHEGGTGGSPLLQPLVLGHEFSAYHSIRPTQRAARQCRSSLTVQFL